jgi:hypothetical protein
MSALTPIQSASVRVPLTVDEDTFALGVIEYGGNLGAAFRAVWPDAPNPVARARELMTRPEVALRIKALTEAVEEHALISLGSHLTQLAEIRDLSLKRGEMKTALTAEVKRGEAVGFYDGKMVAGKNSEGPSNPSVVINIGNSPSNINEWSARKGTIPVIVENTGGQR